MPAYFGNGYLLNILQRGAVLVGKSPSRPARAPLRFEEAFLNRGNESSEVSHQTFKVESESLDHSAKVSTPEADPPIESLALESPETIPVTTRFASHEAATGLPETSTSWTSEAPRDQESNGPLRSEGALELNESSSPASVQVPASSSVESAVHTQPDEPFTSVKTPLVSQPVSKVFELRMPENFFSQERGKSSSTAKVEPADQARVVSAAIDPQAESQFKTIEPAVIHADAQNQLELVIAERPDKLSELQTIELTRPGSITDSLLIQLEQNQVQPSRLVVAPVFEDLAPTPRVEQTSEYLQPRQPSVAPAAAVPPARLQINRLDIQVINQTAAPPPPPPRVADVSQLLEKKHLGRVELLL